MHTHNKEDIDELWFEEYFHLVNRSLVTFQPVEKLLKLLSMEQFTEEMQGIYSSSVCPQTLDESPMVYKNKEVIMEAIQANAVVLDSVKPLLNIKAK